MQSPNMDLPGELDIRAVELTLLITTEHATYRALHNSFCFCFRKHLFGHVCFASCDTLPHIVFCLFDCVCDLSALRFILVWWYNYYQALRACPLSLLFFYTGNLLLPHDFVKCMRSSNFPSIRIPLADNTVCSRNVFSAYREHNHKR